MICLREGLFGEINKVQHTKEKVMDEREEVCQGTRMTEQPQRMKVQAGEKPEELAVEPQELSEKTEEDSQEKKDDIGEGHEKGEKPRKKKSCLGCLGNIIIAIAVILLLIKGLELLGRLTAPEANNSAATKARTYEFWYGNIGTIDLDEDKKVALGKRVLPLLDKFLLEDEKSTVGNDEINTLLTTEYTMDDEDTLAAYTGRKVKLTGKVIYKQDETVQLATDVNFDPDLEGAEWPNLFLDCSWVKGKPDIGDCIEAEGMLIVDPYDFSPEESFGVEVIVRDVKKADYLALGGNPANLFMNQETKLIASVEQKGVTFDVLGASVDAATGRVYVKYQVSLDEEKMKWRGIYNFDIFAVKGSLGTTEVFCEDAGGSMGGSFIIEEEWPELVAQVAPGGDQISIVICGYKYYEGGGEMEMNPDAEIFMRVDIPSDAWTIVG